MKELILLVLGFVLVNNYALSAGLGLTPARGRRPWSWVWPSPR